MNGNHNINYWYTLSSRNFAMIVYLVVEWFDVTFVGKNKGWQSTNKCLWKCQAKYYGFKSTQGTWITAVFDDIIKDNFKIKSVFLLPFFVFEVVLLSCPHFGGCLHFWVHLHFWDHLHFNFNPSFEIFYLHHIECYCTKNLGNILSDIHWCHMV